MHIQKLTNDVSFFVAFPHSLNVNGIEPSLFHIISAYCWLSGKSNWDARKLKKNAWINCWFEWFFSYNILFAEPWDSFLPCCFMLGSIPNTIIRHTNFCCARQNVQNTFLIKIDLIFSVCCCCCRCYCWGPGFFFLVFSLVHIWCLSFLFVCLLEKIYTYTMCIGLGWGG